MHSLGEETTAARQVVVVEDVELVAESFSNNQASLNVRIRRTQQLPPQQNPVLQVKGKPDLSWFIIWRSEDGKKLRLQGFESEEEKTLKNWTETRVCHESMESIHEKAALYTQNAELSVQCILRVNGFN